MVHVETCNTGIVDVISRYGKGNKVEEGKEQTEQGPYTVGQPHQDAGVAMGDVQMVKLKPITQALSSL